MLIGQWRGYFFLNFGCKEGKITRSHLDLRLPSNTYAIEKSLLKIFCNNGVSFWNSGQGIISKNLKTRVKMKTWRKGQSTGRTFSKSGRMKETSNQIKKSARSMFSITFTVLLIQFHTLSNNFGLYVLNKLFQWLLVNLRIIILFSCVFRSKCDLSRENVPND